MDSTLTAPDSATSRSNKIEFYCTSVWKVALFSYLTFGFYWFFWQYNQWHTQKKAHSLKINPTLRTILGFIYIPSLSARLKKSADLNNSKQIWLHKTWSFGIVSFSVLQTFGSIAAANQTIETATSFERIMYLCITDFLNIIFIISFQNVANKISYPNTDIPNKKLGIVQWILIGFGVVLRILFFYSLTLN